MSLRTSPCMPPHDVVKPKLLVGCFYILYSMLANEIVLYNPFFSKLFFIILHIYTYVKQGIIPVHSKHV